MAIPLFTPLRPPAIQPTSITGEYKVLRAQYQDGYSQRLKDGINNNQHKASWGWPAIDEARKDYIVDFMDERGGSGAFYYFHPGDKGYRKWTCQSVQWVPVSGNLFSVALQVQEEFDIDI